SSPAILTQRTAGLERAGSAQPRISTPSAAAFALVAHQPTALSDRGGTRARLTTRTVAAERASARPEIRCDPPWTATSAEARTRTADATSAAGGSQGSRRKWRALTECTVVIAAAKARNHTTAGSTRAGPAAPPDAATGR